MPRIPNQPEDPFTDLQELAVSQHEMFMSWIHAGFTEQQSLYLIGQVVETLVREGIQDGGE